MSEEIVAKLDALIQGQEELRRGQDELRQEMRQGQREILVAIGQSNESITDALQSLQDANRGFHARLETLESFGKNPPREQRPATRQHV